MLAIGCYRRAARWELSQTQLQNFLERRGWRALVNIKFTSDSDRFNAHRLGSELPQITAWFEAGRPAKPNHRSRHDERNEQPPALSKRWIATWRNSRRDSGWCGSRRCTVAGREISAGDECPRCFHGQDSYGTERR